MCRPISVKANVVQNSIKTQFKKIEKGISRRDDIKTFKKMIKKRVP